MSDSRSTDAQFLFAELALANTFLDTADLSGDPLHIEDCYDKAHVACTTIEGFLNRVHLLPWELDQLRTGLKKLKERLSLRE